MRIIEVFAEKISDKVPAVNDLPNQGGFNIVPILNVVYGVAGVIAVVYIIVAGIQYVTSSGDPGKASKALKTIIFALVGLVIVVTAAILTNFVLGGVKGAE